MMKKLMSLLVFALLGASLTACLRKDPSEPRVNNTLKGTRWERIVFVSDTEFVSGGVSGTYRVNGNTVTFVHRNAPQGETARYDPTFGRLLFSNTGFPGDTRLQTPELLYQEHSVNLNGATFRVDGLPNQELRFTSATDYEMTAPSYYPSSNTAGRVQGTYAIDAYGRVTFSRMLTDEPEIRANGGGTTYTTTAVVSLNGNGILFTNQSFPYKTPTAPQNILLIRLAQ